MMNSCSKSVICITVYLLATCLISGESRTIENADSDSSSGHNLLSIDEVRQNDMRTRIRESFSQYDMDDPAINRLLDYILKSIHRYSRPRYGRSVHQTESSGAIQLEKMVEVLSESRPTVSNS